MTPNRLAVLAAVVLGLEVVTVLVRLDAAVAPFVLVHHRGAGVRRLGGAHAGVA